MSVGNYISRPPNIRINNLEDTLQTDPANHITIAK